MLKNTFWYAHSKYDKKLHWWWKWIFYLVGGALLIWTLTSVIGPLNPGGSTLVKENWIQILQFSNYDVDYPDYTIVNLSLKMLWKSLNYTILGTSIGFVIGAFLTILTARNLKMPWLSYPAKAFLLFLRAFPVVIVVFTFQNGLLKDSAATAILAWITMLWTNKYLTEVFEKSDQKLYQKLLNQGVHPSKAFYYGIILKNQNKILMIYLYGLESNLRWSALLGSLGLIGIGQIITSNMPNQFANIGIPLLFLLGALILLELLLFAFNNYLLQYRSRSFSQIQAEKGTITLFNGKKIVKNLFLLGLLIWNFILIFTFDWDFSNLKTSWEFIKMGFSPDLNSWNSSSLSVNPWLMFGDLLLQVIASISIAIIIALFLAMLCSEKSTNKIVASIIKILLTLIRVFPPFVLLYSLDPLFIDAKTTTFLVLTLAQIVLLTKQFSESINNLNASQLQTLKQRGYSWWQINFTFIIFKIKRDIYHYSLFGFENLVRLYIFYGVFSGNLIGHMIYNLYQRGHYDQMFSYVWTIVIMLIIINIILKISTEREIWKSLKNSIFRHQYQIN